MRHAGVGGIARGCGSLPGGRELAVVDATDAGDDGVPELLTPGEVARLFGVDPKTVTRWAAAGKLTAQRTLGGHRRYSATEVHEVLERLGGSSRG